MSDDTNGGRGWYIVGRHTSCAWFLHFEDATTEVQRLAWRGVVVRVVAR